MFWYTPMNPILDTKTAEIISKIDLANIKSVCLCSIFKGFCCFSSSDVKDFPHYGQKVTFSLTISLSQYGQIKRYSTFIKFNINEFLLSFFRYLYLLKN